MLVSSKREEASEMDNNYGYLDQEVEQFAAYVDTLAAARRNDKMGIGCGTALMLVIVGLVALIEITTLLL